ncbi:unnamed protein product [Cuscuta epithymum]|uniref:Josephin-like protein n=1 Tax=Cuscuta epithymum TaxID=186058 RepID=A0AAV0FSQ1_9ASTE|nr:unnamed protein product [Cuscuta epithymum]CAH9138643.1 unnamed protein product [Cuscuta epithymum]
MLRGREQRTEAVFEKQIKFTRNGSLKAPAKRSSSQLAHPLRYYLKRFSGSMAEALRMISPVKCRKLDSSSSFSSSSSSSSHYSSKSSRQQGMVAGSNYSCTASAPRRNSIGTDDHRAEAIDDCIKFINASLSRSKSLASYI